ncbi:MAG: autotransporter-associated beta strand repeat-containing protein, partial [Enterobacteriaceae bacterium]
INAGTLVDLIGTPSGGTLGTGTVTLAGGHLQFNCDNSSATYNFTNNINATANSAIALDNAILFLKGNITVSSGATLLLATSGNGNVILEMDSAISGAGNVNTAGGTSFDNGSTYAYGGAVNLYGDDSFTGQLTALSGVTGILGNMTASQITISSGATVAIVNHVNVPSDINVYSHANINNANILDNGNLNFSLSSSMTYSGTMSGNGTVTVVGGGVGGYPSDLILTGSTGANSSLTLHTLLGTAEIDSANLNYSNVINDYHLIFNSSQNLTFNAPISGSGDVIQKGLGGVTLMGMNTYTGSTTINACTTLQIGNGGNGASLSNSNIINNGRIFFNDGDNQIVNGKISGGGLFYKQGGGTLTVNGDADFSQCLGTGQCIGDYGGKLILAGNNSFNPVNLVEVYLAILQFGNGNSGITSIQGLGNVVSTSDVIFDLGDNETYSGRLKGSANLVKTGNGTLTLAQQNSYTGNTTISQGTLVLAMGSLGSGKLGNGTVTLAGGNLQFNPGTLNNDFTIPNNIVVTANSGLASDNGIVHLTGNLTLNANTTLQAGDAGMAYQLLSLEGSLNGAGNLNIMAGGLSYDNANTIPGAGYVNLAGNNSQFTGNLTNMAGVVRLTIDPVFNGNINNQKHGIMFMLNNNPGNLNSATIVNDGVMTFISNSAITASGSFSGGGVITKWGPATLTLTGDNSINNNNSIQVHQGILQIDNNLSSNIEDDTQLIFNASQNITYSGIISGGGTLLQTGNGVLTLLGNNIYSGTTTINANTTLQVGNCGNSGQLGTGNTTNNGTLIFHLANTSSYHYQGVISGPGQVVYQACPECVVPATSATPPPLSGNSTLVVLYHSMTRGMPPFGQLANADRAPILQSGAGQALSGSETAVLKFINEIRQVDAALVLVPASIANSSYSFSLYDSQQLARWKGSSPPEVELLQEANRSLTWIRLLESRSGAFLVNGSPADGSPPELSLQINGHLAPMLIQNLH